MAALSDAAAFLESYWGRNQVFRTAQFSSLFLSGLLERRHPVAAEKLELLSSAISNMRVMLRLLDDVPSLVMSARAWSNSKGEGIWQTVTDVIGAVSGQLYYPIEHIAWAADLSLIPIPSFPFWTAAITLWGVSLLITALQALRAIVAVKLEMGQRLKSARKKVQFKDKPRLEDSLKIATLKQRRSVAVLTLIQSLSDLVNAVGWMPPGFLWGGRLPPLVVGLCGVVSSLIGLYKILPTKPPQAI